MNKKLFSWKALAGLALLVAMGLTSCKPGTEVDPNDPQGTKKPVTPSIVKGGDLTLQITSSADIATLWGKVDKDTKKKLADADEITVTIKSGAFKLDGAVITLPDFLQDMSTKKGQVLNLVFDGAFAETKNPLSIDLVNYSDAKVNITVPAQAFDMALDCSTVAASLNSAGAVLNLIASANTVKNNALTINSGVEVAKIVAAGAILTNGGTIKSLWYAGQPFVTKKGFQVGNQAVYATNLTIGTAGTFITTDDDTPLGDIVIEKGADLTFGNSAPKVASITGTKASETKVTFNGTADELKNIGAIKNVTVANGGKALDVAKDIFTDVVINEAVNLKTNSLANVEFKKAVSQIYYNANNQTYTFTNVKFASALNVDGGITVATTPKKTTYQWDIINNVWVEVTADAPITAANKSDAGIEVSSNDVKVSSGAITKGADKIGDHKVFTIVTANEEQIAPENCSLVLNKCTYNGAAIVDNNINTAVWIAGTWFDPTWLTVQVDADTYIWKKATSGYVLIKK